MGIDPEVTRLRAHYDAKAPTTEVLDHARQEADRLGLDDVFVVDVDAHREPHAHWDEVIELIENPVMRENAAHDYQVTKRELYVANPNTGYIFQAMHGRVAHQEAQQEPVSPDVDLFREVELSRRTMDAMSIDVQMIFPTQLLSLGMGQLPEAEAQVAWAYNRWMVERFIVQDSRLRFLPYLPLQDPKMAERIVEHFAGQPGVHGFLVTSVRHQPVHDNQNMRLYAMIEETGLPLVFHAGPTWADEWMKTMNRFISVHAISFVHCNIVHLTNWLINGIPERFPKLKVVWVESGLAWIPFLMQRLDHEYLKRVSEAPLLKRLPSEYMADMYYSSQPIEVDHPSLLQVTMDAMKAETQLMYSSDWPHWDFDLPGSIANLPFLSDQGKRNILGLNAAKVFNLDVPERFTQR
jgi:predicted TIM-barrel fold metal-dependent hydrolase